MIDMMSVVRSLAANERALAELDGEALQAIETARDLLNRIEALERELVDAQEALDETVDESQDAVREAVMDNAEVVLAQTFEEGSASGYNCISTFCDMYFFSGIEREEEGPWASIGEALYAVDVFDLGHSEAEIEIEASGVPEDLLNEILEANAPRQGDRLTFNGVLLERSPSFVPVESTGH